MHDVRGVLAARLPGVRVASVTPLGAGLDNTAYLAATSRGDLVVRFVGGLCSGGSDGVARVEREAALLRLVATVSPVAVPEPLFAADGRMAYPLLPGVPLLSAPPPPPAGVAATLGTLLAALHAVPADRVTTLVEVDDAPPAEWLAEAAATVPVVAPHLPAPAVAAIEAFLATAPPAPPPTLVFSHDDLGIEHVLVDRGRVSGIIDWTDAALTDPARDLGLLLRDLGPTALADAVSAYGPLPDDGVLPRTWFHARCALLEDLAHGLTHARAPYVTKSLHALPWLFAP